MFEKIWILLKLWPFSAAGASLVIGAEIATSTLPVPLFPSFGGVRYPPPPYFGGGESIFEGFGVWSNGMLRPFSFFFVLVECFWCLEIDTSSLVFDGLRGCFWRCGLWPNVT